MRGVVATFDEGAGVGTIRGKDERIYTRQLTKHWRLSASSRPRRRIVQEGFEKEDLLKAA